MGVLLSREFGLSLQIAHSVESVSFCESETRIKM